MSKPRPSALSVSMYRRRGSMCMSDRMASCLAAPPTGGSGHIGRAIATAVPCPVLEASGGYEVVVAALAKREDVSPSYFTRLVRLSYLAPDINQAILDGHQQRDLTAEKLMEHSHLPPDWHNQRTVLGFARARSELKNHRLSSHIVKPPTSPAVRYWNMARHDITTRWPVLPRPESLCRLRRAPLRKTQASRPSRANSRERPTVCREKEGFEPSVPRKRNNAFRERLTSVLSLSLDELFFQCEPHHTSRPIP
jgi:hypothetical protein